jgi:hypothetical protein
VRGLRVFAAAVTAVAIVIGFSVSAGADSSTTAVVQSVGLNAATNCSVIWLNVVLGGAPPQVGIGDSSVSTPSGGVISHGVGGPVGWPGAGTLGFGYPAQPTGSLVAEHTVIGIAPLGAPQDQEWFVLVRCGPTGTSQLLFSCFGSLGTCPATAAEALSVRHLEIDPEHPQPGDEIDVSAVGCYGLPAWVTLRDDDDVVDRQTGLTVSANGEFSASLDVPDDAKPGTELEVTAGCGTPDAPIANTASDDVTVAAVQAPSTPPAAVALTTEPKFTG